MCILMCKIIMFINKLKVKYIVVMLLDFIVKFSRLNGLSLFCYVKRYWDFYLMKINISIFKKKIFRFVMRCCFFLFFVKCFCFCDG